MRDREHVGRRAARPAAASRPARSSPGRTSGSPRRGSSSITRRPRRPAASAPAARACAGRRPAARRARRAARAGRRACRRRVPSERTSATRTTVSAACARAAWRAKEPGPNEGAITAGGESSSALVPEPWRSGTITTPARPWRESSPSTSPGSSAGQSPGTSRARSAPAGERRFDAERGGGRLAGLVAVVHDLGARLAGRRRGPRLGRHDDDAGRALGRRRARRARRPTIASASARRSGTSTASARRCFARANVLIGSTATVTIRGQIVSAVQEGRADESSLRPHRRRIRSGQAGGARDRRGDRRARSATRAPSSTSARAPAATSRPIATSSPSSRRA